MSPRSSWLHRVASVADAFEPRAARAESLAGGSTSAAVLQFAAGLYRVQAKAAATLAGAELSGSLAEDLPRVHAQTAAIVRYARDDGPPGLRADVETVH